MFIKTRTTTIINKNDLHSYLRQCKENNWQVIRVDPIWSDSSKLLIDLKKI